MYKSPAKPTCIILILANAPQMFQISRELETGLSEFHSMILTVMRKVFKNWNLEV